MKDRWAGTLFNPVLISGIVWVFNCWQQADSSHDVWLDAVEF